MFPLPHGVACARLLAPVAEANVRALGDGRGSSATIVRYEEVAHLIAADDSYEVFGSVAALHGLVEELKVPQLSAYGVRDIDVATVVAQAMRASSMQGNPVELTVEELTTAPRAAM